jgi:prepilin-type N-terminal cleavage/methylation domain-containing protein
MRFPSFRVYRQRTVRTGGRAFQGNRPGFSAIELVIVLVIGGILAAYAIPGFSGLQRNRAAQNARDSFVWLANRARARAIETGTTQLLEINPITDRAWIVKRNPTLATDTLQVVHYPTEYQATVSAGLSTVITLCYNPRGYAWDCAAGSPAADVDITFTNAGRNAIARVKPLGQVERI